MKVYYFSRPVANAKWIAAKLGGTPSQKILEIAKNDLEIILTKYESIAIDINVINNELARE